MVLALVVQGGGSPAWIDVPERSKSAFMELKRRKVHRYVIFKIDDRREEIVVEKTGAPGESYDDFTASLPADDCRYAVYDLDFVSDDNCRKSKIFFISWLVISSPASDFLVSCASMACDLLEEQCSEFSIQLVRPLSKLQNHIMLWSYSSRECFQCVGLDLTRLSPF